MVWQDLYVLIKKYAIGGLGINGKIDKFPTYAEKQKCYVY